MTFGQASASTQMLAVAKLAPPLDMVIDTTIYAPARLCWRVPQKSKRHPSEGRRLAAIERLLSGDRPKLVGRPVLAEAV